WRLDKWEDDTSSGYCSSSRRVSTRFSTRFRKISKRSEKSVQGLEIQSILEADVAQCDWWIKNPMMRYEE
nr:hypothetical protein [Tanacetum cinerariifolium]